jgi:predicted amidohydrolase YtcJ
VGSEIGQTYPLLGVASALQRRTFHGHPLNADQAVTVYEALRMHTIGGAYALGEEHTRGTLEPGGYADVIAVDRNPLVTSVGDLPDSSVSEVLLGGRSAFRDECRRSNR